MTVLLMLLAIGFGAAAFGAPFRFYSIATVIVLGAFGALTFLDAPRVAANLPTPWIGVWERINLGVFLLWVVVLAIVLWRARDTAAGTGRTDLVSPHRVEGQVSRVFEVFAINDPVDRSVVADLDRIAGCGLIIGPTGTSRIEDCFRSSWGCPATGVDGG